MAAVYDADQVDGIMAVWRKEATKKMCVLKDN